MALKDTVKHMENLLHHIAKDLVKANKGNKAAAQRVRTGSIRLEKIAKTYRKESIAEMKKVGKKKAAPKAKKAAPKAKKAAPKAKKAAGKAKRK